MQRVILMELLIIVVRFLVNVHILWGKMIFGNTIRNIPTNSRYIKSEDILYEIKKIQQKAGIIRWYGI